MENFNISSKNKKKVAKKSPESALQKNQRSKFGVGASLLVVVYINKRTI